MKVSSTNKVSKSELTEDNNVDTTVSSDIIVKSNEMSKSTVLEASCLVTFEEDVVNVGGVGDATGESTTTLESSSSDGSNLGLNESDPL